MAVTVVNGYLCMNGCDAAKARSGQDPHPQTDAQRRLAHDSNQTSGNGFGAAVVYGGALASVNANGSAGSSTASTSAHATTPSVNIIA
jgi:hypothetical protein